MKKPRLTKGAAEPKRKTPPKKPAPKKGAVKDPLKTEQPKWQPSQQWLSESSLRTAAAKAPASAGSPSATAVSGKNKLSLSVSPGILCCDAAVGTIITATASISGPNSKKKEVSVTTPLGTFSGRGSITKPYPVQPGDCGTVLSFSADGVGKHLDAKVPIVKIATETLAKVPSDKGRKKIGVCEEVRLSVTPVIGSVKWKASKGHLQATTGHVVDFLAPDRKNDPVIEMMLTTTKQETVVKKSITCTTSFAVIEPHAAKVFIKPGTVPVHRNKLTSAGFCAIYYEWHKDKDDLGCIVLGGRRKEGWLR